MDADDVRGPDGEELKWPEPQDEPGDWMEPGESEYNDGTPGAVEPEMEGKTHGT
jgi:hypothetical protein